ncbi:MAG: trigger factor [Chloroflexi bacterium]|nr:trigger factor [Chloroflexota bacterium]
MKVATEATTNRQVLLEIELDAPEIEEHKQRAYRKLVQRTVVPGFRKGKAPRTILERYLGAEALVQEDLEELLERMMTQAVEQEKLVTVARPEITEVASLEPLLFKVTVALTPTVDLGDYRSIRLPWEPPTVAPADVEEALENMRRQGTPWEPAARAIRLGDLVTLDARGVVMVADESLDESGDEPPTGDGQRERTFFDQTGMNYPVEGGATWPVLGFSEALVGLTIEGTKTFALRTPDDFGVADLAGKDVTFTVTVHEVKEQLLPQMDDEWAKGVLEGFDSVGELREKVQADLAAQRETQAKMDYEEASLAALEAMASTEFAPIMVESEIDHMLQDEDERMRQMGVSLAAYAQSMGQDPSAFRDAMREPAERRIVRSLLVSELSELEGAEVDEADIATEVERLIETQPEGEARESARQLFVQGPAADTVRRRLLARNTVGRLAAIARGEDPAKGPSARGATSEPTEPIAIAAPEPDGAEDTESAEATKQQ